MFSPAVLVGSRLLFVVYQLLRVLRYLHDLGLPLGPLTLADLSLDHRYWLQATPPWWLALQADSWEESSLTGQLVTRSSGSRRVSRIVVTPASSPSAPSPVQEEKVEPLPPLNELVDSWVRGKLSNFDYLMALNQAEGGWRDLSKSKFRLTRGDHQLDVTYESASQFKSSQPQGLLAIDKMVQVPHHVSEVLADITYYVYMARRLPRTVLCEHVRSKWVPGEYPSSIQRLQEWSPSECIPEFFTDPSVFESTHEDMEDMAGAPVVLGARGLCAQAHGRPGERAGLRAPASLDRHYLWIQGWTLLNLFCIPTPIHLKEAVNQTVSFFLFSFSFLSLRQLTGPSAIKSKNVCLPLVDGHTTLLNCGIAQLFTTPHPHRAASSLYVSRFSAPKTFRVLQTSALGSPQSRSEGRETGEDDGTPEAPQTKRKPSTIVKSRSVGQQLSSSSPGAVVPAETQTIVLPKDYTPLSKLQQLESLCSFCLHHPPHRLPPSDLAIDEQDGSFPRHHSQTSHAADMYLLGCLLVEMSIFSTTSVHSSRNLAERYLQALQVLKVQSSKLPKCLQSAVQVLLQTEKPIPVPASVGREAVGSSRVEWRYPCVCDGGLPPPSAHQLLQPLLSIIPFPSYYPALYDFLSKLDAESSAPVKVYFVSRELPPLLGQLGPNDLDLVMGHLGDLFSDRESSLLAVWQLFDLVGLALGPKALADRLLPVLVGLLSTDRPTVRHLRLFHRSFLLKLQASGGGSRPL
ncbi:hypothetical protein HPB48_017317 [Haemaphysalis longicornis]|uniref:BEACH domain-containing protein n=1 Tax=Haemaphysalis longicornis TaxID=44386 RepID=A0A9J6GYM3_HAELO|nr:hypothetical protein HPB48_017317 [Haemaphysalis longicornis]